MNTHIFRIACLSLMLCLLAAGIASGHTNEHKQFPDFDIPDIDELDDLEDIEDVIEDIGDIAYIVENLGGFGLSMDQEDPITTSLDDAITDVPFLDTYPVSHFSGDRDFIPLFEMSRDSEGNSLLMPGRYDHELETFCLHAGTYGPGQGEGYLYAPLKGPWAHIIRDILKNSETHPEFSQREIQSLVWAVQARSKISDMNSDMQRVARTLLTNDQIGEINMDAYGIIPQDLMGEVFDYINVPSGVERVMRANADIRRLMIEEAVSYDEIEAIAILTGEPLMGEDDREIPAERWSYHPDGYYIRYDPISYPRTHIEIAVPDQCAIEYDDDGAIISIEDEHSNRLELINGILTFYYRDVNDPWNTLHDDFGSFNVNVNSQWISEHRSEVIRLCGEGDWVDTITDIGEFSQALDAHLGSGRFADTETRLDAMDLAKEIWMSAVIRANLTKTSLMAAKDLEWHDWRDSYQPYDPSDDTANPGDRGRQRLGGRHPRPSLDPDAGNNALMQKFKPDKNPEAASTMDAVNKFSDLNGKLSMIQSGAQSFANSLGFNIPNKIFNDGLKWVVNMWEYCTNEISSDPPRFDYDQIADPEPFEYYFLESPADGPPDMVNAQNAMLTAFLDVAILLKAALISVERQSGAAIDGDDHWAWEQAKACVYYRRQAGYAMYIAADRIDEYLALLRADGIIDIFVTPEDFRDGQQQLANEGYSPEGIEAARTLGIPDPFINGYLARELAQDPVTASGSILEAAEELAVALRQYGNFLINLPDAYPEGELQDFTVGISP
jgi:hypothetical protein